MLELMASACMRIGEVLKLRPKDIEDRKAIIQDPKSGKEVEVAFLPQKVADRLQKYISFPCLLGNPSPRLPAAVTIRHLSTSEGSASDQS